MSASVEPGLGSARLGDVAARVVAVGDGIALRRLDPGEARVGIIFIVGDVAERVLARGRPPQRQVRHHHPLAAQRVGHRNLGLTRRYATKRRELINNPTRTLKKILTVLTSLGPASGPA
jgi:hypothetical protein